ncbi:MAG: sulfotransferase [Syntrophaceae bacterium]|nr:sulfotransferase [Syntrophaceae bacterium]
MSKNSPLNYITNYFLKDLPLALKVQLTDKSLISGQNGYTRFIILGRPRTGSNLLMTSLRSHKNIISYGEIFNPEVQDWDIPIFYRDGSDFNLLKEKPVEFISNRLFRNYPPSVKAVGFKMFYSQTPFHIEHTDSVWQYLKEDKNIKIIHLKRRNILKAYLSQMIALKTNKWVNIFNTHSATSDNIKLALDYQECLNDFEYTRRMENEFDSHFTSHEILNIYYENLQSNFSEEMEKIQIFLELTSYPLQPQIFKQTRQKLSEAITNYDELKLKFSTTEWKCFFEE